MSKKQIINKIVNDLPRRAIRGEMTKEEWYGWFEECWNKAINYTPCCKSDSEQLVLFSRFMSNNSKKAAYMTSTELLEEFKKQN